jgi:hypothetical protein
LDAFDHSLSTDDGSGAAATDLDRVQHSVGALVRGRRPREEEEGDREAQESRNGMPCEYTPEPETLRLSGRMVAHEAD